MHNHDVVIVGAGLAGLTCASHLHRGGYDVLLLEANDDIGGRVRTDIVEGFRLDRGFQVLLTAYPETRSELDYEELRLGLFFDGALVYIDGAFHRIADPFRHPQLIRTTLRAPIGSLEDKLRIARLRAGVRRGRPSEVLARPEVTTEQALYERWGFSSQIVDRFFRPFIGGITLDPDLQVSSRMFEFVIRMFTEGHAALPADGMQTIPQQVARAVPRDKMRLNTRVSRLEPGRVILEDETEIVARAVVLATDAPESARLAERPLDQAGRSASCIYFVADRPPFQDPLLVLNGDRKGPIMNLTVQTNAAPSYSPDSRALIAVVPYEARPETDPVDDIRRQLISWFGGVAEHWRHLKSYHVPYALPDRTASADAPVERSVRLRERLYVCGDHRSTPSINGAMSSGRHAARAVAADLRRAR